MVACPFRKTGCDFIGQLQLLTTHKKKCEFNPVNLPSFLKKQESPVKSSKIFSKSGKIFSRTTLLFSLNGCSCL